MIKSKSHKEPIAHLVKRDDLPPAKAWGIRALSIVIGLVFVCFLTVVILKVSPFTVLKQMFEGAFGSKRSTMVMFGEVSLLLIISLAVTPAFKMKFWNIGAEGQVLISAWACTACMFYLGGKIPNGALIFIMLLASLAAGILWAVIPALFKAKWGTNETLFTLMMNYIALQITLYSIKVWVPGGTGTLPPIKFGNLPQIAGSPYALCMIVAAALTLAVFLYMRFSKHGYEVSVVGESRNTAKYIGISVPKVMIRTLVLSGALCAIAGFLIVGGIDNMVSQDTVGGRGFTAVLVSWLAQFNPVAMVVVSIVVVFISKGTIRVMENNGIANSFLSEVLTGMLFLIIIACEFFIRYKVIIRKKHKTTPVAVDAPAGVVSDSESEEAKDASESETASGEEVGLNAETTTEDSAFTAEEEK